MLSNWNVLKSNLSFAESTTEFKQKELIWKGNLFASRNDQPAKIDWKQFSNMHLLSLLQIRPQICPWLKNTHLGPIIIIITTTTEWNRNRQLFNHVTFVLPLYNRCFFPSQLMLHSFLYLCLLVMFNFLRCSTSLFSTIHWVNNC